MITDEWRVQQRVGERSSHTVSRLSGIEKFVCEIENRVFNTFVNFKPAERFKNESDVSEFRALTTAAAQAF